MSEKTNGAEAKMPGVEAIRLLAEFGVKGSDAQVVSIATAGLGEGVPTTVPAIFDRNGQKLSSVKGLIEEYRGRPERRTGTAVMQTLSGFYALVKRHMDEHSAIFIDMNWRAPKFTAVIDYHKKAQEAAGAEGATGGEVTHEPRNLKHKIEYAFPLSEPWQKWVEMNGEAMKQIDFAAFIEERIAELSAPTDTEKDEWQALFKTKIADPFEIVTLSRGLAVSVDAKVSRAVTLQSGEGEMVFDEVHRDGGGQKLTIPGLFVLSLPVFFRGARVRLPVRLRYRVNNGAVIWFYQMWRPDEFVTSAIEKDRDTVIVETGLPAFEGAPEA